MKLQELFDATLAERRRNPELSVRETGHATALAYLQSQGDITNWGVSMTMIPKLGVNPSSKYNTPIGIYFYPAAYYINTKLNNHELEFQDSAPYIQIFQYEGRVLDISNVYKSQFSQYITLLHNNLDMIVQLVGYKGSDASAWFYSIVADATAQAAKHSLGGHLWYILYTLSQSAMKTMRGASTPRSAIVWNKLFRILGVDVVVDQGQGIIHPSEPRQGVVINPSAVSLVKSITNGTDSGARGAAYKQLEKMPVDSLDHIENIMNIIANENLVTYDVRYAKQSNWVLKKCWRFLSANPEIFAKLDEVQIGTLLYLTDDPKVKQQFRQARTVAYYTQQWPRIKSDADQLVQTIRQVLPEYDSEKGKRHLRIMFSDEIKKIKNMLYALEIYSDVGDIDDMWQYLDDCLVEIEKLIVNS